MRKYSIFLIAALFLFTAFALRGGNPREAKVSPSPSESSTPCQAASEMRASENQPAGTPAGSDAKAAEMPFGTEKNQTSQAQLEANPDKQAQVQSGKQAVPGAQANPDKQAEPEVQADKQSESGARMQLKEQARAEENSASDNQALYVTVTAVDDGGKSIIDTVQVEYTSGMSAYDALVSAGAKAGVKVKSRGKGNFVYVEGIGGLFEFDKGPRSGWRYSVNGSTPGKSAGAFKLNPGDVVTWHYSADGN